MIESYKFRLYPTKEQEVLLAKHFGTVRFVYNWALDFDIKKYATNTRVKPIERANSIQLTMGAFISR